MKLIGLLVASLFLFSACGGGSSNKPPASSSSSVSSSSLSSSSVAGFCPAPAAQKGDIWHGFSKPGNPERILVFSKTAGFRHDSIPAGQAMLQQIAQQQGWAIELTEDATAFTPVNLARFSAVVWLSTTGTVLNNNQRAAFEAYIEGGGGYVGIHAAADTEYNWPWYGNLVAAYFHSHPHNQTAVLQIENQQHPATRHLGSTWSHYDEWYNYQTNPRENVQVLMSLDETSYSPGNGAMVDHPIAWYHKVGAGRAFYTGLGHTQAAYADTKFIAHIKGALVWAGRLDADVPQWQGPPPPDTDFSTSYLGVGINLPMVLEVSANNDIYVIGRMGEFYAMEAGELKLKSQVPANSAHEGGLIGLVLDPNFVTNRLIYLHYTDPAVSQQHVARFALNSDNTINFASEKRLLTYPVDMNCCHVAGDLAFDSEGNLYIATGDNTDPFQSSGFAPIDERSGRSAFDAQRTAANTNSLRGKILRIRPTAEGGYTIPPGNLFPADSLHRGEIFAMGMRNPFRITLDAQTDALFWGDVGPDANVANTNRGPAGYDEINQTLEPGNFGWPYFAGPNDAYNAFNFANNQPGNKFDPLAVMNMSVNNTGANQLPNAQPAWITLSHRATMLADVYRWNSAINDPYKLPSYFHGRLLYWNFNNDNMYEADVNQLTPSLRRWLDTSLLKGIIDGKVSPKNNRLYLLAYGGNCCGNPPNSGMLAEVRYIGSGNQPPEPEPPVFTAGDTVSLALDGKVVSAATGDQLTLLDNSTGNSEIFLIVDAGQGTVALRSVSSNRYVTAGNSGAQALSVTADAIGVEQRFQLLRNSDGSYLLKAVVNCRYLSASNNGTQLLANALAPATPQIFSLSAAQPCTADSSHGLSCRLAARAYLNLPSAPDNNLQNLPGLLSQTGTFANVATLTPAASLIPYDLISPLWSDRAEKYRWVSVPSGKYVGWSETGKWTWPEGTVFVKHFELPVSEVNSTLVRRLETRLLVVQAGGNVYGVTYKWRSDNSDADLLHTALDEDIDIQTAEGSWTQTWSYPGPADCLTCHNPDAKGVLGVKTASLNKSWQYPSGVIDNQLRTLSHLGLFSTPLNEGAISTMPMHAALQDQTKTPEHRLRSYWDINCANCHGVQGIASLWDGRFETPLGQQGVVNGAVAGQRDYLADYGLSDPRIVAPSNKNNSLLYIRDKSIDPDDRMPPLGRQLEDTAYLDLLEAWINSL